MSFFSPPRYIWSLLGGIAVDDSNTYFLQDKVIARSTIMNSAEIRDVATSFKVVWLEF